VTSSPSDNNPGADGENPHNSWSAPGEEPSHQGQNPPPPGTHGPGGPAGPGGLAGPGGPVGPGGSAGPGMPGPGAPYNPQGPYNPHAPYNPYGPYHPPAAEPLSFGAKLGIGIALGVVLAGIVLFCIFWALAASHWNLGLMIGLAVPAVAVVGMFFTVTRAYATGVLIAMAAAWLTVIGPCLILFRG